MTTHSFRPRRHILGGTLSAVSGAVFLMVLVSAAHLFIPAEAGQTPTSTPTPPSTTSVTASGPNSVAIGGSVTNSPINSPTTISETHPTTIVHVNENEGILKPGHLPTPPLPQYLQQHPDMLPKGALNVFAGTNLLFADRLPFTILTMSEPMIQIDQAKGHNEIKISILRVFDDRDDIIARIDEGQFWVRSDCRFKHPDSHTLVVYDHLDQEVLRLSFLNPEALLVSGIFRHPGYGEPFIITPTYWSFRGNTSTGTFSRNGGIRIDLPPPWMPSPQQTQPTTYAPINAPDNHGIVTSGQTGNNSQTGSH